MHQAWLGVVRKHLLLPPADLRDNGSRRTEISDPARHSTRYILPVAQRPPLGAHRAERAGQASEKTRTMHLGDTPRGPPGVYTATAQICMTATLAIRGPRLLTRFEGFNAVREY